MNTRFPYFKTWTPFATFAVMTALFGLSCGSNTTAPPLPMQPLPNPGSYVDTVCGDAIFSMGRPVQMSALSAVGEMGFELREVHFRDVVLRNLNEIEFAFRTRMKMDPQSVDGRRTYLVPEHSLECNERNRPSRDALRLSRTTIPVVGDLHLPTQRITASPNAFSVPRINEMTVSNGSYYSFNNQNWGRYAQVQTLSAYVDLLKNRALFDAVEIREMSDGWIGIYAEKNGRGRGRERAQLMILLARTY
jgi:hypothetical protein